MRAWEAMGLWGYGIGLVTGGALAGALLLAVVCAVKWRPPAFLWFFGPAGVVVLGALGTAAGMRNVLAAIAMCSYDMKATLASAGASEALRSVSFGLLAGGWTLAASALLLGLGAVIGAGKDATWRSGGAAGAVALGLIGGIGSIVAAVVLGGVGTPLAIGPAAAIGALGVGLASLRLPEDPEEGARPAAARPAAAAVAIFAVAAVAVGAVLWARSDQLGAATVAEPASRAAIVAAAATMRFAAMVSGGVALAGVLLASAGPILAVGTLLPGARSALGGVGTALVVIPPVLAVPLAIMSLSALDPLMGHDDLVDVVKAIALPDPKDVGNGGLGGCVVLEASPDTWAVRAVGGETCGATAPVAGAFVAIAADRPASRLLTPISPDGRFAVLARPRGALASGAGAGEALQSVAFAVVAPEQPAYAVFDDATGERVAAPDGTLTILPGDPDGFRQTIAALRAKDPAASFVLVPRDGWTVQDVVARCALLGGNAQDACPIGDRAEPEAVEAAGSNGGRAGTAASTAPGFKQAVTKNQIQLQYCYEQRLKTNPDLGGRVEVRWMLDGGVVKSAEVVANTTGDRPLADCIGLRAKSWKFASDLSGDFTAPFVFHSVQ